jgi:hypothetical protein
VDYIGLQMKSITTQGNLKNSKFEIKAQGKEDFQNSIFVL